jgi:hypothetical protein
VNARNGRRSMPSKLRGGWVGMTKKRLAVSG